MYKHWLLSFLWLLNAGVLLAQTSEEACDAQLEQLQTYRLPNEADFWDYQALSDFLENLEAAPPCGAMLENAQAGLQAQKQAWGRDLPKLLLRRAQSLLYQARLTEAYAHASQAALACENCQEAAALLLQIDRAWHTRNGAIKTPNAQAYALQKLENQLDKSIESVDKNQIDRLFQSLSLEPSAALTREEADMQRYQALRILLRYYQGQARLQASYPLIYEGQTRLKNLAAWEDWNLHRLALKTYAAYHAQVLEQARKLFGQGTLAKSQEAQVLLRALKQQAEASNLGLYALPEYLKNRQVVYLEYLRKTQEYLEIKDLSSLESWLQEAENQLIESDVALKQNLQRATQHFCELQKMAYLAEKKDIQNHLAKGEVEKARARLQAPKNPRCPELWPALKAEFLPLEIRCKFGFIGLELRKVRALF